MQRRILAPRLRGKKDRDQKNGGPSGALGLWARMTSSSGGHILKVKYARDSTATPPEFGTGQIPENANPAVARSSTEERMTDDLSTLRTGVSLQGIQVDAIGRERCQTLTVRCAPCTTGPGHVDHFIGLLKERSGQSPSFAWGIVPGQTHLRDISVPCIFTSMRGGPSVRSTLVRDRASTPGVLGQ